MDTAYFDNSATTFPKPQEVYTFMDNFYRECGVNSGRGQYNLSSRANTLIEDTRGLLLKLLHCENKQVIFTSSATEGINLVLNGLKIFPNDNVYISPFEHNAILRTLHNLKKSRNFNLNILSVNREDITYNLEDISRQFKQNPPRYVIVSHASNVCGAVAPIKEIFSMAKMYNATTILDMAQTCGLVDTNLNETYTDFAIFAGHKTLYAPFGVAGIVANRELLTFEPLIYGGTGTQSAMLDMPMDIPTRYESGSHNILAIAGLYSALNWIFKTGIENLYLKDMEHKSKVVELLQSHSNVKVYTPKEAIGIVSCNFDGYSSDNIGQVLNQRDIAVRTGLHCSPMAHQFLQTFPSGTVRFSVSYFNSPQDFEKLADALDYIELNS
jgi:cysteine desulfurase family protein